MATQSEAVAHAAIVGGGETVLHSHAGGGAGVASACRQTEQATNSSNVTPSNIPGLAFPVLSGRRYYFRFLVTFRTAATTTGVGFCFSGPTMTAANWRVEIRQAAAGTDQMYQNSGADVVSTTVLVSTGVIAANTDYIAVIEGFCQPSADGTLQLRCRSEVNASQITIQNAGVGLLVDAG